jgi:hypothetical protein
MSSGLLPHNPGAPSAGSGAAFFVALTVGNLIVTGIASVATLAVSGAAVIQGVLSSATRVASDIYENFTSGSTVTLRTTGSNANVLLSPNGTGSVVTKAAAVFTADSIAPTTAGAIALASTSNGNINLNPNGTGRVEVNGAATDGPLTVNHTANAGVIINKTNSGTGNGYRTATSGTFSAEFGHNINLNETYLLGVSGDVKLLPASTEILRVKSSGIVLAPITTATPRFELGTGNSNNVVVAYVATAGNYFSGSTVGDMAIRNASSSSTKAILLGVSAAAVAALQVTASAVTSTLTNVLTSVANNNATLKLLGLDGSNNVTYQDTSSGTFTSTFTIVSGFVSGPTNNSKIDYLRVGNVVCCSCWFDPPAPATGTNVATITLPVARATNFTNDYQCTGYVSVTDTRNYNGYVRAIPGATDKATLTLNGIGGGAVTVCGSWTYVLT